MLQYDHQRTPIAHSTWLCNTSKRVGPARTPCEMWFIKRIDYNRHQYDRQDHEKNMVTCPIVAKARTCETMVQKLKNLQTLLSQVKDSISS